MIPGVAAREDELVVGTRLVDGATLDRDALLVEAAALDEDSMLERALLSDDTILE